MEQRQPERKTDEQKRKEIMQIQDRQERLRAIARNMSLFTNKKER